MLRTTCFSFYSVSQPHELAVFQQYYDNLVTLLTPENIGPKFVSAGIITIGDYNKLRVASNGDMILTLLEKVSSPLETGDVTPFKKLLDIMENYGTETVKDLSERITREIESSKLYLQLPHEANLNSGNMY